uniref:Ig-like domain-containing protein n=1 Tax=Kryptolebias marmoratus TaxID=37003 RepID=A0A3Q3GFF4_KRYMA
MKAQPDCDYYVLTVCFFLLFTKGSSLSEQIVQTLVETLKNSGETAKISCSHSIQSYDQILWYKQSQQYQMQLLGYMYGDSPFPEKGVDVTMEGSANKDQTCTLIINKLNVNSSGVYFCAASYHSAAHHSSSVQEPSF